MAPSEVQADLDINLDRLSLPTEPDGPFNHGHSLLWYVSVERTSLLHRTEARIGATSATKYGNLHAAACCPGSGGASCRVQEALSDQRCRSLVGRCRAKRHPTSRRVDAGCRFALYQPASGHLSMVPEYEIGLSIRLGKSPQRWQLVERVQDRHAQRFEMPDVPREDDKIMVKGCGGDQDVGEAWGMAATLWRYPRAFRQFAIPPDRSPVSGFHTDAPGLPAIPPDPLPCASPLHAAPLQSRLRSRSRSLRTGRARLTPRPSR